MRPVLMLEINEVPIKVYQKYAADPRYPHVRELLDNAKRIETLNSDEGELSPWSTWPTIHRGLPKREHGIHHLGQDPATYRGVPIWDEVLRKGLSVGVFGSLQSWPPRDPGANGFYVPDTFAPSPECIPKWIEPIQALNLGLVRENGRVMSESLMSRVFRPGLLLAMLKAGVRPKTLAKAAFQLLHERVRPSIRQRRVSFQALLFWDIFRRLFRPGTPPAFSTFFTNHVASVEHRYWNHVFPEDFTGENRPLEREHLATMDFAMDVVENILAEVFAWRRSNPDLLVVVANSMGQGARIKHHHGYELMFDDSAPLFHLLGIPDGVKQNLAMAPQLSFDLVGKIEPDRFMKLLASLTCLSGRPLLHCDRRNDTVTVTVDTPPPKEISNDEIVAAGKTITLAAAGIRRIPLEGGTAYHVPQGDLLVLGLGNASVPSKVPVPAHEVKKLLMDWAGLSS